MKLVIAMNLQIGILQLHILAIIFGKKHLKLREINKIFFKINPNVEMEWNGILLLENVKK